MSELTIGKLQESLDRLMKHSKFSISIKELKKKYKLKSLTVKNTGEVIRFEEIG